MSRSQTDLRLEYEGTPSTISKEMVDNLRRGERKIYKGDPEKARRCFRRARRKSVVLLSSMAEEYSLNQEQVKRYVGRDIDNMNDDMMQVARQMSLASVEQQRTGNAPIKESTLMDVRELIADAEDFYDLLVGIEEGRVVIQE